MIVACVNCLSVSKPREFMSYGSTYGYLTFDKSVIGIDYLCSDCTCSFELIHIEGHFTYIRHPSSNPEIMYYL